ncbi:hypothetical protein EVAR_101039_1 [Eumeta japonica]|uniref:Uncharacterized protein n=1 Tax=Eumeta variegata TaxID=151549 RepID=A0A4C1TLU1_EUMVA|nr:hypothetical protein EVAR_101039_1 [Eumeta japonica]
MKPANQLARLEIFSVGQKNKPRAPFIRKGCEYSQIKTSNGGKEAPSNVDTVFITLPCKMAKRGKLVLLVKTGANSSIVKESKKLKGVSTTLGVVKIDVGENKQQPWMFQVVARGSTIKGDGILGRDNIWGKSKLDSIRGTLKIFNDNQWVKTFTLHAAHECEAGHQRMACLSKGQRQQYQSIQF